MSGAGVPNVLQRLGFRLAGLLCFNRIVVRRADVAPAQGPVLYLGLHRNGALDGIPYHRAAPRAAFMVSAQLQRSALARVAFPGIAVARGKDRRRDIRADNGDALARCVEHLIGGGALFVMPEGTSTLGPRHLPFKTGAAHIAYKVLQRGAPLVVVPLAVNYECAWEWQSRVEVVMGTPLRFDPGECPASVAALHERFAAALEDVGCDFADAEAQQLAESLAYVATLGTSHTYSAALARFAAEVPPDLRREALALHDEAARRGLRLHQGVPLMPLGSAVPYWLAWLLLTPPLLAAALANLPPLLAGRWAAQKLPDDRNVVAFWRALVGLPAALLWSLAILGALWPTLGGGTCLGYVVLSAFGVRMSYRYRKLSAAAYNALRAPDLRPRLAAFHSRVLEAFDHA